NSSCIGSLDIERQDPLCGGCLERDIFFARPSATSCFIGQPFALCALDRVIGASTVVDAEPFPVAIPKIQLLNGTMQVFFADVEITGVDAAVQDREKAFNGVGVGLGAVVEFARPLLFFVTHRIVTGETATDSAICAQLIGHQSALNIGVAKDDAAQRFGGD